MAQTMTDMMDKKSYAGSGMLWGLIIGVAAGLLLAPESGRQNRQKLQRKMGELKQKAKQGQEGVADKVGDAADKLQSMTDKAGDIAARGRNRNDPTL